MYAVDGGRRLTEQTLPHLPGYAGSTPVRIGNGAALQRQLDVLGEVMIGLEQTRQATGHADRDAWALQRALVEHLADTWRRKDHGLWEIRGPQQRFTHSQAMVWAAFDRAVRAVEEFDLDGAGRPLAHPARPGPRRGARPGLRRRAQHVRAVLRQHRGRRRPARAPPDRDRGRRRPADARHHRGGRARPDARRPAAALPHPDRRRRPLPATSTRSWRAPSGWSRRTPPPAASTTRPPSSTGSAT